jgi:hypothetical protein
MANGKSFAKLGAPLSELQAAAADRLQDAETLFFVSSVRLGNRHGRVFSGNTSEDTDLPKAKPSCVAFAV